MLSSSFLRTRSYLVAGTAVACALAPNAAAQSARDFSRLSSKQASSIIYSTYLGGDGSDLLRDFATDNDGNAYLTGLSQSNDFLGIELPQSMEFVVRVNPDGSLGYVRVLSLSQVWGIEVDDAGNAFVVGSALEDFPADHVIAPAGIHDSAAEVVVLKLNSDGETVFSTMIRGSESDSGSDISLDSKGRPVVSGVTSSPDFPTTPGVYQPDRVGDGGQPFILKLSDDGSEIIWSTFFGVSSEESIADLALDSSDRAVFVGIAGTTDLPTVNAFQPQHRGGREGYVARMDSTGSTIDLLTYLGGSGSDTPVAVDVKPTDGFVVAVNTASDDYPLQDALYATGLEFGMETAVTSFTSAGALDFSTYLGGHGVEIVSDLDVDPSGRILLAGRVAGVGLPDFQPVNPFQTSGTGGFADGYVIELSPDGQSVALASLIGGTADETELGSRWLPAGNIAVAGQTISEDFPVTANAIDPEYANGHDVFLTLVDVDAVEPSDLVIQVMQDSLGRTPEPVANTVFEIGRINEGNPQNPFVPVTSEVSDDEGRLTLDPDEFTVGDPYYVRVFAHQEPAVKEGHEDVDGWMYEVEVDNVFVTRDGSMQPDTLEEGVTTTYLGHATFGFNLVVSIEWPVDPDPHYRESLERAFRMASNLLFDASNGQMYLHKIAVYDDKQRWSDADLRIYAANTRWPAANPGGMAEEGTYIVFPPRHYGTPRLNADSTWWEGRTVDADRYTNVATIVHEFGHYSLGVYDEYVGFLGIPLPDRFNFGIMDKQNRREAVASEFSAYSNVTPYRLTEAFKRKGKASFEVMRDTLSATYGNVVAAIHTPARRGMQYPDVIEGPNEDLGSPDWDIGSQLEVIWKLGSEQIPIRRLRVRDANAGIARGSHVEFDYPETGRSLKQGKTVVANLTDDQFERLGNIAIRGARPGAILYVSTSGKDGEWQTSRIEWPTSKSDDDPVDISLQPVAGDIRMRSIVAFDNAGQLDFGVIDQNQFETNPSLTILREDAGSETFDLLAVGTAAFRAIPGPLVTNASLRLERTDSLGNPFFVPYDLSVIDVRPGARVSPEGVNVEVFFDSLQAPERIAMLSSRFPEMRDGLSSDARRVSPVYMIDAFPPGASVKADLKVYYDADSLLAADSSAVTVFQWGDDGWMPLDTRVDPRPSLESATARITERGEYAAFLDLTKSTGVGVEEEIPDLDSGLGGLRLEPNFPNPFESTTELAFTIPDGGGSVPVQLIVYDLLGRRVATLLTGSRMPGRYQATWDVGSKTHGPLTAGVYVAVLRAGDRVVSRPMVLAGR